MVTNLGGTQYTVKSGDTLTNIITRICGNDRLLNEIAKSNKLVDPNFIFVGQNLLIDCSLAQMPLSQTRNINSTGGILLLNFVHISNNLNLNNFLYGYI